MTIQFEFFAYACVFSPHFTILNIYLLGSLLEYDLFAEMELTPVLFEQPVHRDDWEGLGLVTKIAKDKYGVSVAADESCRGLADVRKIAKENLADVINIKLAKVGVLGALDIIEFARLSELGLMIGGMVETKLAMGFAGHLAAGLGCFK